MELLWCSGPDQSVGLSSGAGMEITDLFTSWDSTEDSDRDNKGTLSDSCLKLPVFRCVRFQCLLAAILS